MGHPCDYFVKVLLAQNWGKDDDLNVDYINKVLWSYSLPFYKEAGFNELMGSFHVPDSVDFNNRECVKAKAFMKAEKIYTLWNPEGDDERVVEEIVEGLAVLKFDIHLLTMGNLPSDVAAEKLNFKYGFTGPKELTGRMLETYAYFFWNKDNVSLYDWNELLAPYPNGRALMAALYCGPQQAMYRCGLKPKVDVYSAIREVHRQAYFRLEALRYAEDSHQSVQSFSSLSAKILSSHEIMTAQGAGLQDQLKQFRTIMMKHNDPDIKQVETLINKLEGGSYSGEAKPTSTEAEE